LQRVGTAEDVERLKQVLRDEGFDNLEEAVEALESVGEAGQQALQAMALQERNPGGAYAIARQGDERGREILVERLHEGGAQRENAAEFLRELRDERCIPFFAEVLRTTTHWRGAFVALELGRIGTPEAVAALVESLSKESLHVRRGAVRGLAEAKDPASIEPLIECLLTDGDSKVRGLASSALVAMGQEAAVHLTQALTEGRVQGRHRESAVKNVLNKLGVEA
jgi:HEAT repeat protein